LVYQKSSASSAVYLQLETLTPPATDLPSRRLASLPSLASPVKRIIQLDEEQDVTSRLEEVRAVSALLLPLHSATVLKPVRVAKTLPGHSRVSAWVSDDAEGTGVALVVVETDAVTTGRIGLSEVICIQCSLLAARDSRLRSLEEVRAVSALLLPLHSATVLKPVRVAKTLPGHG
jgi:hypothetical protein